MYDESYLYEFCLDWQMGYIPRQELIKNFSRWGWSFDTFKRLAQQCNWYVSSMEELKCCE